MKKLQPCILMLALAIAPLFVSCSSRSTAGSPKIAVVLRDASDPQILAMRRGMESEAQGKALLSFADGRNAQPEELLRVESLLREKPKALALSLVDRTASRKMVEMTKTAGVPVVFFERRPLVEDMPKWDKVYYVGSRAEEAGTLQGRMVADWWKAHPEADRNGDGRLQCVVLTGKPGDQLAVVRSEYTLKALEEVGIKVERLAEATANWTRVEGQERMVSFLAGFGQRIEFVICNDDGMALGAIDALKAAGWFSKGRFMPVVGIGATREGLEAVAEGSLIGTVKDDTEAIGRAALALCLALAGSGDASKSAWPLVDNKYVWIAHRTITRENLPPPALK